MGTPTSSDVSDRGKILEASRIAYSELAEIRAEVRRCRKVYWAKMMKDFNSTFWGEENVN